MVPIAKVLDLALAQAGDRYVFGAEVRHDDPDPETFDCSELIEWAAVRAGVSPRVPDGSWYQARHLRQHGTLITIGQALKTRGALLFRFSSSPFVGGRPKSAHVALSLGDGRTMEARSTALGVGIFPGAEQRVWTHAGLLPGVAYPTGPPVPTTPRPDLGLNITLPTLALTRPFTVSGFVRLAQGLIAAHGVGIADTWNMVNGRPYADGVFGPGTEAAVRTIQSTRGVNVDGIIGGATWRTLLLN